MIRQNSPLAVFCLFTIFNLVFFTNTANAQYNDVNFGGSGVSISYFPSGSDGTDQGDIILYENVLTYGGNSIDCYVVVDSITGSGLSTADQSSTSGSGYSNNAGRFFSPFLNLPSGGGTACFSFQFVADGTFSYSSSTNYGGTNATIDSVRINSYDLDGNGSSNSNQFTEFGGFTTSELHTSTNLSFTTSTTTGLTRWISTSTTNTSNATAPENRIRVFYDTMSSFQIAVGAGSSGWAYFFLEFASGNTFTPTQTYYQVTGNVFNDTNGLHNDGHVNGAGIGTASSTQLYANLINSGDSVLKSVPVNADGSYEFNVVADGTYDVILTSSMLVINSTGNSPSLPSNWVNTGENLGLSAGNDGAIDGSISVTVNGSNIENANLAINKRPETLSIVNTINTPDFGDTLSVAGTPILGGGTGSGLSASDNEEGTISSPNTIHITSLPDSSNKLIYDGVEVTLGQDGVNPPSASNPFVITNFDQSKLKFIVSALDYIEFYYAVVDNAGLADLSPAVYNYNWSSPVPVQFVYIKATLINAATVNVEWTTATEVNNSHFEVQRFDEETNDFFTVGIVEGTGNSVANNTYNFLDNIENVNDDKLYYRIKQVDFDGNKSLSEIAILIKTPVYDIEVYPIPAQDEIIVDFELLKVKELNTAVVEVISLDGRVMQSVNDFQNNIVKLNTSELISGVYFVKVSFDKEVFTKRIIVKH